VEEKRKRAWVNVSIIDVGRGVVRELVREEDNKEKACTEAGRRRLAAM
jgi:hypothetical protein